MPMVPMSVAVNLFPNFWVFSVTVVDFYVYFLGVACDSPFSVLLYLVPFSLRTYQGSGSPLLFMDVHSSTW